MVLVPDKMKTVVWCFWKLVFQCVILWYHKCFLSFYGLVFRYHSLYYCDIFIIFNYWYIITYNFTIIIKTWWIVFFLLFWVRRYCFTICKNSKGGKVFVRSHQQMVIFQVLFNPKIKLSFARYIYYCGSICQYVILVVCLIANVC